LNDVPDADSTEPTRVRPSSPPSRRMLGWSVLHNSTVTLNHLLIPGGNSGAGAGVAAASDHLLASTHSDQAGVSVHTPVSAGDGASTSPPARGQRLLSARRSNVHLEPPSSATVMTVNGSALADTATTISVDLPLSGHSSAVSASPSSGHISTSGSSLLAPSRRLSPKGAFHFRSHTQGDNGQLPSLKDLISADTSADADRSATRPDGASSGSGATPGTTDEAAKQQRALGFGVSHRARPSALRVLSQVIQN